MQATSDLYKQILSEENHWFECALTIGESGVLTDESENWIDFGRLYISGALIDTKTAILVDQGGPDDGVREDALLEMWTSSALFPEEGLSVGNACAAEIYVKLVNIGFSIPRMARLCPYIRVTNGDEYSEWIPQGVFFVDTRKVSHNEDGLEIVEITGFDALLKAEGQFYPYDTVSSASTITSKCAELMGVELDDHCLEWMTDNHNFQLQCSGEWTVREHLSTIAALYCGNFCMTNEGKLTLITLWDLPVETRLLTDEIGYRIVFGEDVRILV